MDRDRQGLPGRDPRSAGADLPGGIHALEAWNEAVCDRVWGKRSARFGERLRRAIDLEHWAAFGKSFSEFERLLTDLATGSRGEPPASITVIGGDVHHNYLAPVEFPARINPHSAVHQAVCSPIHNILPKSLRRGHRVATSPVSEAIATAVARLAGVRPPRIRWRITRGPLTVDEASYEGGTMGADHPIAWCHDRLGGRSFYTALGHTDESFAEPAFLSHLRGALSC